eukprot:6123122-Ditylum_brightwellii.AAC.1
MRRATFVWETGYGSHWTVALRTAPGGHHHGTHPLHAYHARSVAYLPWPPWIAQGYAVSATGVIQARRAVGCFPAHA